MKRDDDPWAKSMHLGPMEFRGRFTDVRRLRTFIEAGDATLTIQSKKSGNRFTYRFRRPKPTDDKPVRPIWVSVLTGSDNEGAYSYACSLFTPPEMRFTSRSKMGEDAPSMIALAWFLRSLYSSNHDLHDLLFHQAELWHEGRCGRCGRKLTVPESIASGFGPECAGRIL